MVRLLPSAMRKPNLFCLPHKEGGDAMYITWEALFLFCSLIIAIISLVIDICNNKKR